MKKPALLLALAVLLPAGTARADFVQDVGSPLPTGVAPYGVAAADFNGDGRPDVAAANGTESSVSVFLRGAGGGFSQEASSPVAGIGGASDIAVGDFNGDGKRDLAVAGYGDGAPGGYVLLRKADNTGFALEGGVLAVPSTTNVAVGDLDGNGKSDLVFGTLGPNAVYYALRNDAGTAFNAPVKLQSVGQKGAVALGDFTGDGQLDIVAANWTSPASIELWVQNDNHTFPGHAQRAVQRGQGGVRHGGRRLQQGRPPRRRRRRQPERQGRRHAREGGRRVRAREQPIPSETGRPGSRPRTSTPTAGRTSPSRTRAASA